MKIWIDGDACPVKIKEILFKAANRTQTEVVFVANQFLSIPASKWVRRMVVGKGFDVADDFIVQSVTKGDVVISADIPLAHDAIENGAIVLSPRGKLYHQNNIKQALAMRDFNTTLRDSGVNMTGPSKISEQDVRRFANELDKILAQKRKA